MTTLDSLFTPRNAVSVIMAHQVFAAQVSEALARSGNIKQTSDQQAVSGFQTKPNCSTAKAASPAVTADDVHRCYFLRQLSTLCLFLGRVIRSEYGNTKCKEVLRGTIAV